MKLVVLAGLLSLQIGQPLAAQSSLVLSPSTGTTSGFQAPAGALSEANNSLSLALSSPAGNEPAAIQWTFSYPSSVTGFTVTAGPALTAAGKSITCMGGAAAYTCLAYGVNANIINNGVVGTVSFAPVGSSIAIAKAFAVSAGGSPIQISSSASQTSQKDITAPTVPAGVTAKASSSSAVTLAWTASTDDTAVTGYKIFRNGVQIASITTGTTYADSGLTPLTTYTYTVAAFDAAGNVSAQSTAAAATTSAKPVSNGIISRLQSKSGFIAGKVINLTLSNATFSGNELIVAVSDYYANANDGATFVVTDSFQNTWKTAVDYQPGGRMIVFYAENIKGGANHQITITDSNPAGAYFLATAVEYAGLATTNSLDATAKNRAANASYTSTPATTTQANELLFGMHHVWNTTTVFTPAAGWNQIETSNDGQLQQQTTQDQMVTAIGSFASAGTESVAADTLSLMVTFKAAVAGSSDTAAPTVPTSLSAKATSAIAVTLAWTASTDNTAVTGYKIFRNGAQIATATTASYQDNSAAASTSYSYTVAAFDAAGNASAQSVAAAVTTPAPPDTTAPSIPASLTAKATSATAVTLAWTASTDNTAVTGYKIFRNGAQIATATAASFQDSGLTASTTYTYTVAAFDAAGNASAQSVAATVATQANTTSGISRVQSKSGAVSPGRTLTITLPNTTVAGNELIVAVSDYYASQNDGASFSITDTFQNTWRAALDYQPGGRLIVFYAENIVGGANHQITITASVPTGAYFIGTAMEYAGLATTNSLDVTAKNRAAGLAYTSTAATTSQANELLLGLHHVWNTTTVFTPAAGWKQIETKTDGQLQQQTTQDQVVSSMGSFASTGAESTAADTLSAMVAFRGASAKTGVTANATPATEVSDASTAAASDFLLRGDASELSGSGNGATVTPTSGINGKLVTKNAGAVNFTAGNGVSFANASNSFFQFAGAQLGDIFNAKQGQVSFNLKSNSTFAQRTSSASPRVVFDVHDQDANNHIYSFMTRVVGGNLQFAYSVNNVAQFYYVPQGTEDAVFGNGVTAKVTIAWDGASVKLSINGTEVQSTPYVAPASAWTATSSLAIGAYQDPSFGALYSCDDAINDFAVGVTK